MPKPKPLGDGRYQIDLTEPWRPIPLQVPEDEDQEADVHQGPLPVNEGLNPPGPRYF